MVILQILEGDITNFYYLLVGLKNGENSIFVLIPSYVKWEQQKLSHQFLCMCNTKKLFLFLVSDGDGFNYTTLNSFLFHIVSISFILKDKLLHVTMLQKDGGHGTPSPGQNQAKTR
jgi:hypothetical protein